MFYTVVRIIVVMLCCTAASVSSMHMLQSQRYQISALRKDLQRYNGMFTVEILVAAVFFALNWFLPVILSFFIQKELFRENLSNWLVLAMFTGVSVILYFQKKRIPQRKPFSFTRRIARLAACTTLLNLIVLILLHLMKLSPYILFAVSDYVMLVAAVIMRPIEEMINARYYKAARKKLAAAKGLIRIGITGSYGKTETKIILKTILSEKYRVLSTPPSFSTAMGISRVVLDQLKKGHQVFIAEMGAQQKGEIREMAKLVHPHYGVLTCIGDAHKDSFGSIEAAAQTKFELIQSLKDKGVAFFGSDGSYGDRLYGLCKTEKYRAALGAETEAYMHAEYMETSVRGTRFKLVCADGDHAWVQAKLLGRFSVRNIALAASVARKLGMSMEEIVRGIEKLRPIRHHMQLIPGEVNVIDDSENCNPDAAAEALNVLKEMPGRRILVTCGLREAGGNIEDTNYAFGASIPGCADYVVLIGPEDTLSIHNALKHENFPMSCVRMVRDEYDAAKLVEEKAQAGDTVLYEGIYPEAEEDEEE